MGQAQRLPSTLEKCISMYIQTIRYQFHLSIHRIYESMHISTCLLVSLSMSFYIFFLTNVLLAYSNPLLNFKTGFENSDRKGTITMLR